MIPSLEHRHALGGRACPCFGGDSSSSAATTNTTTTTQVDNRRTLGNGSVSAENSTVNVQTLDGAVASEAIATSRDDLRQALNFATGNVSAAYEFAKSAQGAALDSLNTEAGVLSAAYADAKGRGALTDKILIGAILMAGLVAVTALRKH